ncbi:MAG TPA: hypothetical protein VFR07_15460 [Mycobacteriales bacterium]|nr:hypothetical protein [Mycobacteriales bacterium]
MEHDTGAYGGGSGTDDVIGREAPPRAGRRRRGVAVAAGAVLLVGGGGAAALAASTTPSPSPSGAPAPSPSASPEAGAPQKTRPQGGGYGLRGLGGALHGQLTVPKGETYEEVLVQRGTVSAVSPTSLEVRSADGYSHTYTLNAQTQVDGKAGDVSTLAVDDTVGVLAGTDSTARVVTERGNGHRLPRGEATPGAPSDGGPWSGRGPGKRRDGTPPSATPPSATPPSATPPSATPGGAGWGVPSAQGATRTA